MKEAERVENGFSDMQHMLENRSEKLAVLFPKKKSQASHPLGKHASER